MCFDAIEKAIFRANWGLVGGVDRLHSVMSENSKMINSVDLCDDANAQKDDLFGSIRVYLG